MMMMSRLTDGGTRRGREADRAAVDSPTEAPRPAAGGRRRPLAAIRLGTLLVVCAGLVWLWAPASPAQAQFLADDEEQEQQQQQQQDQPEESGSPQEQPEPDPDEDEEDNLFGEPIDDEEWENLFGEPNEEGFFGEEGSQDSQQEDSPGDGREASPDEDEMIFPTEREGEDEGLVALELRGVKVTDLAYQIADFAGKPVWVDPKVADQTITIFNGQPVTPREAFDLLGSAIFEQKLGLVDRNTYLAIVPLSDISYGDAPMIGPDEDILDRTDRGMIAVKVFQLTHGSASGIVEALRRGEIIPAQYAKVDFDEASNQIVAMYNIGTLQRIQRIVDALDVEGLPLQIKTFHLEHRDAESVAQMVVDLFSAEEEDEQNIFGGRGRSARRRSGAQPADGVATTTNLRVTFDRQTNSVTVRAEEAVLDQIEDMIENYLDQPIYAPDIFHYDLQHSDVIQVRDMLREMFAPPDESVGTISGQLFGGQQSTQRGGTRGSSGAEEGIRGLSPYAGQLSFEADATKNRLFVIAQSEEALRHVKSFLDTLDEPSNVNSPILIELRYANAEELADQLNALLQQVGGGVTLRRSEQGLTQGDQASPFSQDAGGGGGDDDTPEAEEMLFPWQSGQPPEDERPISGLIGQMRVVPIARQNAILILARPEHRATIKGMIDQLDQPGRQVLIMATIAEASEEAVSQLGLRFGSDRSIIDANNPDNQINVVGSVEGSEDDIFPDLFDTSVLSLNVDLTAVLSLLHEDTDSSILSDPRIFTSDNEEAVFFDGQDIPFITDSQVTDTGQTISSFDYRAVGIRLSVRPHITVEGNVDMQINIELSSIVPGQTLFGGFIVDRRETNSRVTVLNRQTIVVSGILRYEDNEIMRKVPFLGDIPVIGPIFFRSKDHRRRKAELLAFVTPVIVENPDQAPEIFERENRWRNEQFPEDRREFGGEPLREDPLRQKDRE